MTVDHIKAEGSYKVNKVIGMGAVIKIDGSNVLVKTKQHISEGDIITIKGKIETVRNNSEFDLVTYLKTFNISHVINARFSHIGIQHTTDFRVSMKDWLRNSPSSYAQVTPLLFIGEKTSQTKAIFNVALKMNIVHLFVISGFHISLFQMMFKKILELMKVPEKYASWISLVPIVVYIYLLNFPLSALRATLLSVLSVINKNVFKSRFRNIHILSVILIGMFIANPNIVYSISFILTFLATYVVLLINSFEFKNERYKYIAIAVFAYSSNVAIVAYLNHFFTLFGIVYGILLGPVFVVVYAMTLVLFPFKWLLDKIDWLFILLLETFEKTNLIIDLPKFSIKWVFAVYGTMISSMGALLLFDSFMNVTYIKKEKWNIINLWKR
ncbi:MAG: ComEC/Rec2 family competence protein [Mycoplasmataceae bacterium]|nr:ComEC/Rec2 family competence protein [Mycoplasmataceae bacterium]